MRGQAGILQRLWTPRGHAAVEVWACTSHATPGRVPPASPPGWRTIAADVLPAILVPAGAAGRAGLGISAGGQTAACAQTACLLCYVREVWPGFSEDVSSPAQGVQVIGISQKCAWWTQFVGPNPPEQPFLLDDAATFTTGPAPADLSSLGLSSACDLSCVPRCLEQGVDDTGVG
jgi:hypothetical protein